MHRSLALVLFLACNGGKDNDDDIVPKDDADADTDTDSDTDADTDADTDTEVGRCDPLPEPTGTTVEVGPTDDLGAAVAAAAPGTTLLLQDGTYLYPTTLRVDKPLTIRSASGARDRVTIDGRHSANGGDLVEITSSDVTIAHLTLISSWDHLVGIRPAGADVTGVRLHDLALIDPGRYAVYVEGDGKGHWVDNGELTCSHLELTDAGRALVRGECDTGGIDAYGARGWTVRDNTIVGFWCEFDTSGPGIRFTRGARDTLITRNVVGDVAFGIVLGETEDQLGRTYDDDPCGALVQSIDGKVINNIVYAYEDRLVNSGDGVLTGIRTESSCNVDVIHNSVYSAVEPSSASIDHRYTTTTGVLANNLVSHSLRRVDDSQLVVAGNLENVAPDTWYFPAQRDFHTSPGATWAIDQGVTDYLDRVTDDVDGEPRDDGLPDIGADEL